jgi:indole-3-glycerol phosphate synthase
MKPASRLSPILFDVRQRLAARRADMTLAQLRRTVKPDPERARRFTAALRDGGLSFIAECKRRSPSAGAIADEIDWGERARRYADGGAAAISVLTEEDHFGGAPSHLAEVEGAGLPRLRKDFLLDESMVLESALWGADAVLLLVCILEPERLAELLHCARAIGLAALVEVHDERELELAVALDAEVIGVNARDLASFQVDLAAFDRLIPRIPRTSVRVAESGLSSLDDLRRARAAGADAALVGEALMRSDDPALLLRGWKEALRGA